ncbi:MAG: hypothetical protein A3J10_02425 [Candidatus Sungbacteria bacterium RIFCSPLOWO2_02_FULL_54_10]|uniref:Uncharacterized protein n=2 Tax=Candidatus Sungiibacteriota TaxID=1817917 RepID=A0A1G2L748_9BACT|nr:MAG: hypothetical protein A2679_02320 [Candidatus Sungbacteria bacterium RIFCSPHIGHO2_01_FULL_54_26]OHA03212.1 MAG: hypothetical protein A3C92_01735 [Candidatus Sungbacteria bacterium RIFCSPHIGHO2_02_FULL_53_17]OHA06569.1 MAG: hypothetical protein A3B34_01515 [Candidatus Sungbacteria bacterium RIFCSPLOWO2_01_FULL_54_21]OHA13789.1 MAG: hypothetical protein A3J10_02425 [Candidatus Sungbacteria bacterium RIFCSPLOWO2_02_FULL_54_10]
MTFTTLRIPARYTFVAVSVVALAAVGIAAWGFAQAIAIVWQGHAAQAEIRQNIGVRAEERQSARASEVLLRNRQEDIRRIGAFFVPRHGPIAFIEAVEYVASRTGNTISLDIDENVGGERALRFRLTVEGGANGLVDFMRAVELLPYKIDIQDMVFQDTSPAGGALPGKTPSVRREAPARLLLSLDVSAR